MMNSSFKIRLTTTVLILSFFAFFCWGITTQTCLLRCESKSLQGIHYLVVLKSSSLKRGDIVFIKDVDIPYIKQRQLAKRVLGLPGDEISHTEEGISIQQKPIGFKAPGTKALPLLKTNKEGKLLTPLSATYVPEGYVFVGGDHPRSFDSRYEEFGLVPIDKIWGKALMSW